jgi:protein-disulfide isomerase
MLRHRICLITVFALVALAGAQQKPAPKLPSEETVNAFLQQTFGYQPDVTWKIVSIKPSVAEGLAEVNVLVGAPQQQPQATKLYVTADGEHALVGDLIPFGTHPFKALNDELQKGINGPTRGPADSPVTIVEFSDLQCPHCKDAQPTVEKLMADEKDARFVFQNFPLPMHDWANKAASYADCVGRANSDAFWKFIDATYESQAEINAGNADEKLTALADKSGVKGADMAACAAKPDTAARIEHSLALGKSVDVTGTPALFINGRKIAAVNGIPYEVLKSLVEFAAKQPK